DEQLLGRDLEQDIARWYRGSIQFIIELRPHSVIKDEAIPALLRRQSQPTFVTINERDFWRRVAADRRYCIVCFPLPDSRVREIPRSLRLLLRRPEVQTKAQRMGKILRATTEGILYYTVDHGQVKTIPL
ncbi:MAG: hypothetical protein HY268_00255, partial [Deltaproteobacteria bacterium]|nr:hypothetical protein [Deltaproteobacteria bacterium]